MADRGPPVPDTDTLHRIITPTAAAVWFPHGVLSSAAFSFPIFSVDIARLSPAEQTLARWPVGSGIAAFHCESARQLGFDARQEPEHGNNAHANVYNDFPANERKRRARQLAAMCQIVAVPVPPQG